MLPSLTFPDQVRGSLNGISAAAGKSSETRQKNEAYRVAEIIDGSGRRDVVHALIPEGRSVPFCLCSGNR